MADKKNIIGVNPSKTSLADGDLGKLATLAPQYYQYLMNPDSFDYNTLPTGQSFAKLGKYSGYNIDYDALRAQLKSAADAKAAQAAADAKAQADAAAATAAAATKRQNDIASAKAIAQRQASDVFKQWGVDPNAYSSGLGQSLDDIIASLGDSKDPYSTLNGKDIATQLLEGQQTTQRNQLASEANKDFGLDYGNKLINSHLLDDTINQILSEQQGGAQDFLNRGKARGIYNDVGYNAGEKSLQGQAQAGQSQIAGTANDVLDKYRSKANDISTKAFNAANNATLGQSINLDDYVNQGNDILNQASTYGSGDLRTALGGQQFFDFSGLTNAAGGAQGATNLRDSNIAAVLADRAAKKNADRGLGSQGVF